MFICLNGLDLVQYVSWQELYMSNVTHEALATTKCLEHAPSRGVIDFEDGYCGKQTQQSFAEQCKVTMLVVSMSCLASEQVNLRQLVEKRHDDEALRVLFIE